MLNYITWTVDPELLNFWIIHIRWYGLLFACGFAIGYYITQRVFQAEKLPEEWLDYLLLVLVLGTIAGARLGHVFFYQWDYYQDNLVEIPMIWKGGLASHGGAIGIFTGLWLFSRYVSKKPILWASDRLAMSVALTGCMIRLGNLMNHEIVGAPTEVAWAFIFTRYEAEPVPRHPSQLYEAIAYLLIFIILFWCYWRTDLKQRLGYLTGLFFVLIFGARFLIEFVKEVQVSKELEMTLNLGQWLSIPLILIGLYLMFRPKVLAPSPPRK
ncbi:MAG: prolipoprotein diacylglyceryl transferase [Bacteroidota bacterium]